MGLPGCKEPLVIVVFDIGNVLVRWNPRNLFRKTMNDEARMERFLAAALSMDFVSLTDIAADFSQAVAERARAFPEFAASCISSTSGGSRPSADRSRRMSRYSGACGPPAARSMRSATSPRSSSRSPDRCSTS